MRLKGESGFGAVPGDELVDGVFVNAARGRRAEAVKYRQFAMIQIWKQKHSVTVIRLDFLFAHSDGGRLDVATGCASRARAAILSAMAW